MGKRDSGIATDQPQAEGHGAPKLQSGDAGQGFQNRLTNADNGADLAVFMAAAMHGGKGHEKRGTNQCGRKHQSGK